MKKRLFMLLMIGVFSLTGCQSAEEKQQAEMMEAFEQMGVEHNEVIMSVLSKKWQVLGSSETYEFTKEGTGNISGKAFDYACGFDDDHQIMLQIIMDETEEEFQFFVKADDTGHGLFLKNVKDGAEQHLLAFNVTLLNVSEEEPEILGEWADKSDNRYVLKEDMTMVIKSDDGEKEGTYSVVRREETALLTLVFGSNTLEFEYELPDETTIRLCAPGTETVHTWIKK